MPIDYIVLYEGRELTSGKDGFTWVEVRQYDSADLEAVFNEGPFYNYPHSTLPLTYVQNVSVKPASAFEDSTGKALKTITWGPKEKQQRQAPNQYGETWEWQMLAQTKHVSAVPPTGASKTPYIKEWRLFPYKGEAGQLDAVIDDAMIGRDEQGKFQGCEIYQPTGALRVSKEFEDGDQVNSEFRQLLYDSQAKVNNGPWIDWDTWEIMFLGASIRIGTSTSTTNTRPTVTVDYNFIFGKTQPGQKFKIHSADYDPGLTEVEVGDIQPFVYVWLEPFTKTAYPQGFTGENAPTKEVPGPLSIKVAQMYDEFDFGQLGLVGPEV